MGKIIRRVIAALLCITALIIAVLPAGTAVATTSTHDNFIFDGNTIVKYLGDESEVTIPNWVNRVGKDCFANNTNLQKVVIPDSVTTIDYNAFENCVNLQIAVIPESVRTIGSSAFSGCSSLYSVSLPAKLESIGSGVFAGCSSLSEVPVNSNNSKYTYLDGVVYSKDGKELVSYLAGRPYTTYSMPNTIEQLDEYAFWGSKNLEGVSISNKVKAIPEYAFAYCSGLKAVSLPRSVERINAYAFQNCSNLQYINIPDTVGYIDDKAFDMTKKTVIRLVDVNGNVIKEMNVEELTDDTETVDSGNSNQVAAITAGLSGSQVSMPEEQPEPEANQNTYNGSFSGEGSWISEIDNTDYTDNVFAGEIGSSKILGDSALVMIPSDTEVKDGYDLNAAEQEDEYASLDTFDYTDKEYLVINGTYAVYNGNASTVTIPDEARIVGDRVFYQNINISNVELPYSLMKIDDFAFARSNLRSINIPEGVTEIGYGAFYNCPLLSDISIPASLSSVQLGAFSGTPWLDDWTNNSDDDFLIIGDGILYRYKGRDTNVVIPGSVKKIAPGAFADNSTLKSVTIPGNVSEIGEEAFNNCTNLEELILKNGVESIKDRAFRNAKFKTISIPASVKEIGLGAFDTTGNNSSLQTVIFEGKSLPNVSYNNTATRLSAGSLREGAFAGASNAIISIDTDMESGNILNPTNYGFTGQVYTVNTEGRPYTLTLQQASTLPDLFGNVIIDPHVRIGADDYILSDVKEHAFDYYNSWPLWCDIRPSSFKVEGNSSDNLNGLLSQLSGNIPGDIGASDSGIYVNINGDCFPAGAQGRANLANLNDTYILNVSPDDSLRDVVTNTYYVTTGSYPDRFMQILSIDLLDKSMTIPIHKFGNEKMEISLPVPKQFGYDMNGVRIACLDENGMFNDLSSNITSENGINYINFVASHLSTYIIYRKYIFNSSTDSNIVVDVNEISNAEASLLYNNAIVKTLHKEVSNGIEVKWFVIVILVCFAGILVVYKPKNHIK